MIAQLQRLLLLQEIDALLQDLAKAEGREAEERLGFSFGSLSGTRMKRTRIAKSLEPEVLERYEQVRRRHFRAVVPVRRGVCLGCFTVRPTKSACGRQVLETCERCGRILFRLDDRRPAASPAPAAAVRAKRRTVR